MNDFFTTPYVPFEPTIDYHVDHFPFGATLVHEDDISDIEISYHVDHFRQCYVVDDRILNMRTSIPYDSWPGWRGDKFLKHSMIHMRYRFVADFQEAFYRWPPHQALITLGTPLDARVAMMLNLVCRTGFVDLSFFSYVGEPKYSESSDWMLRNPEANWDAYEMEFTVKGLEMAYDENLFRKVRRFLSPTNCQIINGTREMLI